MLYPQNGDRIVAVYFVTSFALCIIWYRSRAVTPCGWEGNRRIGIALAMRHRLIQLFIQLRAHGLRKGDEPTLLVEYGTPLPLPKLKVNVVIRLRVLLTDSSTVSQMDPRDALRDAVHTAVHDQCDELASLIGRTSTVANVVNLVHPS